jgi:phosphoglycolate phosphatase-like HAD superfamily hydrolase
VLLLFDVDGTLLHGATAAHRDSLLAALRKVHGVDANEMRPPLSPAGRTDGEIARAILLDAGVEQRRIDERADAVREECCREYAERCPRDLGWAVLPGIGRLLGWLSQRKQATPSLLTGNYEPVARLKLARAGIGRHFATGQGAFGSDAEDRAALPPIGRRRAGTAGVSYPREQTLVIGDTPRDIACAHADSVRCVAVATGPFKTGELGDADAVAANALELREVLEALGV